VTGLGKFQELKWLAARLELRNLLSIKHVIHLNTCQPVSITIQLWPNQSAATFHGNILRARKSDQRGEELKLHAFLISEHLKVSGELHVPTTLPPHKDPRIPIVKWFQWEAKNRGRLKEP
jgi:hypothetical protein